MRCDDCRWKYPDSYLNAMFINGGYTAPICGICALERSNRMSGITRTTFQGEMAEATRQAAIEWRLRHPTDGPINGREAKK